MLSNLWNQEKYEHDFHLQPEVRRLAQSKGRCRMKLCPQKGDNISFVYKGKIVMRGECESIGFEVGTAHQTHSCNIGDNRPHSDPHEFAWVINNRCRSFRRYSQNGPTGMGKDAGLKCPMV